eukprot:CAMPEP_0117679150 /NCGR_PEP_ID=MMETSP0804-20121206/17668_1 /TAXON_ID=1074897 /ORGANISM="Tetraselmis astigmatica, Strain CCMP880" /LENGTH=80 /DNA_ID=CAMNT_0005488567 /DNA_START=469 /DNA_END=708 /DNA_ORIENTATION=+
MDNLRCAAGVEERSCQDCQRHQRCGQSDHHNDCGVVCANWHLKGGGDGGEPPSGFQMIARGGGAGVSGGGGGGGGGGFGG